MQRRSVKIQLHMSIHVCAPQASRWAKKTPGSGEPVGEQCFACAYIHAKAFADLSWEALVAKSATDPTTKAHIRVAQKVLDGLPNKTLPEVHFTPESTSMEQGMQTEMSRKFLFLEVSDFKAMFGMSPVEAGLPVVSVKNELAQPVSGVVLKHSMWPFRELTLSWTDKSTFTREVQRAAEQLRPDQGRDFFAALNVAVAKSSIAPVKAPLSAEDVHNMIEEKKAAVAARAAAIAEPPAAAGEKKISALEQNQTEIEKAAPAEHVLDEALASLAGPSVSDLVGGPVDKRSSKGGKASNNKGAGRGGRLASTPSSEKAQQPRRLRRCWRASQDSFTV